MASSGEGKADLPRAADCVYRLYQSGDEGPLNEMFNEVFNANRPLEAWHWKYVDDPAGEGCIALGCLPGGRMVAHYSGYPLWLIRKQDGKQSRQLTFHAGDVLTRPEARSIGIGKSSMLVRTTRVFQEALECKGVPFYFGFNTDVARKFGQMFQGYRDGGAVGYWQMDVSKWQRMNVLRQTLLRFQGWDVSVERQDARALDNFFAEVSPCYDNLIERGAAYLAWRYFSRPDREYRMVTLVQRGKIRGWAVFWKSGNVLHWGDALFSPSVSHRHIAWLLCQVMDCYANETLSVEGWFSPHPAWWSALLSRVGFVSIREPHDLSLQLIPVLEQNVAELVSSGFYYTWGDSDLF